MADVRIEDRNIDEAVALRYLDARRVQLSLQLLSSYMKLGALRIRCDTMEVLARSVFNPQIALAQAYVEELVVKVPYGASSSIINAIINQVSCVYALRILRVCEDISRLSANGLADEILESSSFSETAFGFEATYLNCGEQIRVSFYGLEVCDLSAIKMTGAMLGNIFNAFSNQIREVVLGRVQGDPYRIKSKLGTYFTEFPSLKRVFLGPTLLFRGDDAYLARQSPEDTSILQVFKNESDLACKYPGSVTETLNIEYYAPNASLADVLWPKPELEPTERTQALLLRYFKYGTPVEHEGQRVLHLDDRLSNLCLSKPLSSESDTAELADEIVIPVDKITIISRQNERVCIDFDGAALEFVFTADGYFPAWTDPHRYAELFELCFRVVRGEALQDRDLMRLRELFT